MHDWDHRVLSVGNDTTFDLYTAPKIENDGDPICAFGIRAMCLAGHAHLLATGEDRAAAIDVAVTRLEASLIPSNYVLLVGFHIPRSLVYQWAADTVAADEYWRESAY